MFEWVSAVRYFIVPVAVLTGIWLLQGLAKTTRATLSEVDPDSARRSQPATTPPAVPDKPTDWTTAITIGGVAFAIVIVIAAGIGVAVWRSRHLEHARQRANRRQSQLDRWATAGAAFNEICSALAEFETDPESVYFNRPLLADVTEPASAAFYTAFAAAQDLHTENVPVDDDTITAFAAATAAARTAFDAADANARRKARNGIVRGDRTLTTGERRKVGQAQKLMAQAADASATSQFARTAHDKALSLLAEVGVDIPQRLIIKAAGALEADRRLALTRS
jgi:hypothetical protein